MIKHLFLFLFILYQFSPIKSQPFQLIKNESAILVTHTQGEIKLNGILEYGQIPTSLINLQYRYGVLKKLELSSNIYLARFTESKENRLASFAFTAKTRTKFIDFRDFHSVVYLRFRMAPGRRYTEIYQGRSDNIIGMVSPYADEGRDLILGYVAKKQMLDNIELTLGMEYMRAENRDYFNFTESQKNVLAFLAVPQMHFHKEAILLLLENKYTYWINRGALIETIPELRWEIFPEFVVELGVNLPIYGGKNYQYTFGFTYEIGK